MSMLPRRRRTLTAVTVAIAAATVLSTVPANADCVTAGAWVRVGTTHKTVLADGTCVVPTDYPWFYSREVYHEESAAAASVSVGLTRPRVGAVSR